MPYIWNPDTKRSEWKQWYQGKNYGTEPDPYADTDPDPNAPLPPENPKDEEGNGITPAWDWDQPDFAAPGSNPANQPGYTPPTPTNYSQSGTNRYEGWDPQKIASGQTSPKYLVGRVLSNFDPRQGITPAVLAELNKLGIGTFEGSGQNLRVVNASPEFEGYTDWGDMIHGYEGGAGANAAWQYGINNSRDAQGFAGTVFPAPGTYTGAGQGQTAGQQSSASTPSFSTGSAQSSIDEETRARILDLLRTPRTVDPKMLANSPEMQAVQYHSQRAEERDRAAMAERAAVEGWSGSGGFEGGLNALREQRGATEMQFMGQLAVTYMERQREDLVQGIEFSMNQGQFDAAQQLKRELAALDAAIAREKITADVGMNNAELDVRKSLGLGDLDLRRFLGAGQLGYDYAALQYQANKDAANKGLDG